MGETYIPRCWSVTLMSNYNLFLSLLKFIDDFVKTELLLMLDLSIDLHSSWIIEYLLYFNFEKLLSVEQHTYK